MLPSPIGRPAAKVALVVVGAQEGWRARCVDGASAHREVQSVAAHLGDAGVWVVGVVHRRPSCRRPRRGSPPEDSTLLDLGCVADAVVDAAGHDGFHGGRLEAELASAGRDTLLIVGFGAETTVNATVRSAHQLGFHTLVAPDAVGSLEAGTGRFVLETLTDLGLAPPVGLDQLVASDRAGA